MSQLRVSDNLNETHYVNESVICSASRENYPLPDEDDFEIPASASVPSIDDLFPDDVAKEFDAEKLVIDCRDLKSRFVYKYSYHFLSFKHLI